MPRKECHITKAGHQGYPPGRDRIEKRGTQTVQSVTPGSGWCAGQALFCGDTLVAGTGLCRELFY
jgi:hypothetical protein